MTDQKHAESTEGHAVSSWVSDATRLTSEEVNRYNRAMLIPEVGPVAYERMIRDTSVLVIGAGGLGSTCCLYLAAGGVRRLGIADSDVVEVTNLHRQIIHTTDRAGMSKAESAAIACRALNPLVFVQTYPETRVHADNVLTLVSDYDIIVDATDNVSSRYTISDACVLTGKPLVSGAAVCWDGQLLVLNNGPTCPCYRCLHPTPPPTHSVQSCADVGVFGPIPGAVGALMAMEVQKLAMGIGQTLSGRMLHFDGQRGRSFVMTLRPRDQERCAMCSTYYRGIEATSTRCEGTSSLPLKECLDYPLCPRMVGLPTISSNNSIHASKLTTTFLSKCIVLDVRPTIQFALCRFPRERCRALFNIPLESLLDVATPANGAAFAPASADTHSDQEAHPPAGIRRLRECLQNMCASPVSGTVEADVGQPNGEDTDLNLLVVCRRGLTSSHAIPILLQWYSFWFDHGQGASINILNVECGLNGYSKYVDSTFPTY